MHALFSIRLLAAVMFTISAGIALAQTPAAAPAAPPQKPLSYGPSVSLDVARRVAAVSIAEAAKNGWTMSVAVTDTAGELVYFERMDDCQTGSTQVAIAKARSSSMFKRPTKAFNDSLAAGNTYILSLPNAIPIDGGFPLVVDGKIIGAIGASGGTGMQDSATAAAGRDALK